MNRGPILETHLGLAAKVGESIGELVRVNQIPGAVPASSGGTPGTSTNKSTRDRGHRRLHGSEVVEWPEQ